VALPSAKTPPVSFRTVGTHGGNHHIGTRPGWPQENRLQLPSTRADTAIPFRGRALAHLGGAPPPHRENLCQTMFTGNSKRALSVPPSNMCSLACAAIRVTSRGSQRFLARSVDSALAVAPAELPRQRPLSRTKCFPLCSIASGRSASLPGFTAGQYRQTINICIGQTMCANQLVTAKVSIYAAAGNYICQIPRPVILEDVKRNRFALL
jgi:hypothetical protein